MLHRLKLKKKICVQLLKNEVNSAVRKHCCDEGKCCCDEHNCAANELHYIYRCPVTRDCWRDAICDIKEKTGIELAALPDFLALRQHVTICGKQWFGI